MPALRAAGSAAQVVTVSNNASGGFIKQLGNAAHGVIVTQVFPNVRAMGYGINREAEALAKAKGKYRGRRADQKVHAQVVALRQSGHSISKTAELAGCSSAQVKRIWAAFGQSQSES